MLNGRVAHGVLVCLLLLLFVFRGLTTYGYIGTKEFGFGWPLHFVRGQIPVEFTIPAKAPRSLLIFELRDVEFLLERMVIDLVFFVTVACLAGKHLLKRLKSLLRSTKAYFVLIAALGVRAGEILAHENRDFFWPHSNRWSANAVEDMHTLAYLVVVTAFVGATDWFGGGRMPN